MNIYKGTDTAALIGVLEGSTWRDAQNNVAYTFSGNTVYTGESVSWRDAVCTVEHGRVFEGTGSPALAFDPCGNVALDKASPEDDDYVEYTFAGNTVYAGVYPKESAPVVCTLAEKTLSGADQQVICSTDGNFTALTHPQLAAVLLKAGVFHLGSEK